MLWKYHQSWYWSFDPPPKNQTTGFFVFPSFNYVGIKKTLNASTYENMLGHGDSKQKQKYAFTSHH